MCVVNKHCLQNPSRYEQLVGFEGAEIGKNVNAIRNLRTNLRKFGRDVPRSIEFRTVDAEQIKQGDVDFEAEKSRARRESVILRIQDRIAQEEAHAREKRVPGLASR